MGRDAQVTSGPEGRRTREARFFGWGLIYSVLRIYWSMTSLADKDKVDVFGAIADPARREILEILARGGVTPRGAGLVGGGAADAGEGVAVGDLVRELGLRQPAVSKHLGILRRVGVVSVTKRGQQRLYRLEARELKAVYDWVKTYDRFWTHQMESIKARAERIARERGGDGVAGETT